MESNIKDQYSDEALRSEVQQRMGREVPERIWQFLKKRGDIAAARTGVRDLNSLTDQIWDLLEISGEQVTRVEPRLPPTTRVARGDVQAAISIVVGCAAANRADVLLFRKEILNGQLLRPEDVRPWIEARASKDRGPRGWIRVPLPAGVDPSQDETFTVSLKGSSFALSRDMLLYAVPDSDWQHASPVSIGGTLDRLRVLSRQLARDFDWHEAAATYFILTGIVPLIPSIRVSVKPQAVRPRDQALTYARGRISLDVDIAVTPNEVSAQHRRVRRELLKGGRVKRLSPKHLALAVFSAQRPDDEPWDARLLAWNREHPNAAYSRKQLAHFKRDSHAALERLLGARITVPQALGWAVNSDKTRSKDRKQRRTNPRQRA